MSSPTGGIGLSSQCWFNVVCSSQAGAAEVDESDREDRDRRDGRDRGGWRGRDRDRAEDRAAVPDPQRGPARGLVPLPPRAQLQLRLSEVGSAGKIVCSLENI